MQEQQLIDALHTLRALLRDEQTTIASTFKDLHVHIIRNRKKSVAEIIAENYPKSVDEIRNNILETAQHISELYRTSRTELVPEVLLPAVDRLFEHPEYTCDDILELYRRKTLFPKVGMVYRGFRHEHYPDCEARFHVDDKYVLTHITVEPTV